MLLRRLLLRRVPQHPTTSADPEPERTKLGPGSPFTRYVVFVSSGDDLIAMRNKVEGLIERSVNPELASRGVFFKADLWERDPPRRLLPWETVDDEFVERACDSDLVMALLLSRLGAGTKKEILAVLRSPVELKLLWFVDRDERPNTRVARFLRKLARRQLVRYRRAGRPGTDESEQAITQVLVGAAVEAITRQPKDLRARP